MAVSWERSRIGIKGSLFQVLSGDIHLFSGYNCDYIIFAGFSSALWMFSWMRLVHTNTLLSKWPLLKVFLPVRWRQFKWSQFIFTIETEEGRKIKSTVPSSHRIFLLLLLCFISIYQNYSSFYYFFVLLLVVFVFCCCCFFFSFNVCPMTVSYGIFIQRWGLLPVSWKGPTVTYYGWFRRVVFYLFSTF